MQSSSRRAWLFDAVWVTALAAASSAVAVAGASRLSATFDEPLYLERGLGAWRDGSQSGLLKLGTMPLPANVQSLPVYLWECWRGEPFVPARDFDLLLPIFRLGTLLFWWALLAYAFLIGRRVAGPWAGRLAVALLAFEPSLVAHAGLATTDIALTACVLALLYHFQRGREPDAISAWRWRAGVPMLCFALAVLAKASGLVYGLLCLSVLEAERLARSGALTRPEGAGLAGWVRNVWGQFRQFRSDLLWIAGGGLALVFVYCGSDWRPQASFVKWAGGLPDGAARDVMLWLAENLCIFSNAGEGIVRQIKHNMNGHGVYLFGNEDTRSLWYYFPALLTVKMSVPVLLAPTLLGLLCWRALANWPLLLAAVLLAFSLTFRVQIGVRLVFPVVALTTIGVSAAAVTIWREAAPVWRRGAALGWGCAAALWTAGATAAVWPHGISYVNELWGGTRHGWRVVSEANYDWGQGLIELAAWQQRHGVRPLACWYFGTDPRYARLPLEDLPLHTFETRFPQDVERHVRGKYLAVSTTLVHGPPTLLGGGLRSVQFLRRLRPVARTTTFFIYDFTDNRKM